MFIVSVGMQGREKKICYKNKSCLFLVPLVSQKLVFKKAFCMRALSNAPLSNSVVPLSASESLNSEQVFCQKWLIL